jgi:hypothetical protein
MAVPLSLGLVHHRRLTVTDVPGRSLFLKDGIVMVNGDLLLGLRVTRRWGGT